MLSVCPGGLPLLQACLLQHAATLVCCNIPECCKLENIGNHLLRLPTSMPGFQHLQQGLLNILKYKILRQGRSQMLRVSIAQQVSYYQAKCFCAWCCCCLHSDMNTGACGWGCAIDVLLCQVCQKGLGATIVLGSTPHQLSFSTECLFQLHNIVLAKQRSILTSRNVAFRTISSSAAQHHCYRLR